MSREHPFKEKLKKLQKKTENISIIFRYEPNAHYYCKLTELRDEDFDCELRDLNEQSQAWCEACQKYDDIFQIRWNWTSVKRKELENSFKKEN